MPVCAKRIVWHFLASRDHPETFRRKGWVEEASVRKVETSRHPGIFTSCICRRIAGYQHLQLSWAHLPPAIYLRPYREYKSLSCFGGRRQARGREKGCTRC